MRTRACVFIVLAACWAGAAGGAPVLDPADIREGGLPNGLRVVVKRAPHWDTVAVGFSIKASPLYEEEREQGLSDLVRYMMFEASGDGAPSVAEALADLGVRFRSYTSPDGTQVSAVMSSRALPEVMPVLARAVFEPRFDEAVWARQLPELRRRLADSQASPLGRLWRLMWEMAFRQHPYGRPVAGAPDAMAAFDTSVLARFHEKLYVPNNVSLVVVGDVTADSVFELAAAHLGGYEERPLALPSVSPEPPQTDTRTRLEKAAVRATIIAYAWHAVGIDNKRDVCALDLIYAMLGQGQTARLMKALTDNPNVEAIPEVEFITKRDPGLFIVWCAAKPDAEFEVRDIIESEVARLRDEPVTEGELAVARDLIRTGYAFDNQTYAGQVGSMAFYEAIDSYRFAVDYIDEVEKVTVQDIQRVARELLGASNHTLVIIRPRDGGGPVWEASLRP